MADTNNLFIATPDYPDGTFHTAPRGTTLPTNATDVLPNTYTDLGLIGEDGYSYNITRDSTDIKAFGGSTVANAQTDYAEELTVTLMESNNADVLREVFGDAAVTEAGGTITVARSSKNLTRKVYVVDTVGQDGGFRRLVLPLGQVTGVGEVVYVHSDVIKYQLTIKAYPDVDGFCSYEHIENEAGS